MGSGRTIYLTEGKQMDVDDIVFIGCVMGACFVALLLAAGVI